MRDLLSHIVVDWIKYQVGRGNGLKTESIISLKDSPIILNENIIACNGIIHSIDTVMLPIWW